MNVKKTIKNLLATTLLIGSVGVSSLALAQPATAAEINRSYTGATLPPVTATTPIESLYILVDNDLAYYRDKQPTANDISREAAAKVGAQALVDVFGLDLKGATFEMAYNPADNGYRADWQGEWWVTQDSCYFFSVDALTGALKTVQNARTLDAQVNTGMDMALEKNQGGDYRALAEELALEYGAITNGVQSVEYTGQGSTNNDPALGFNLTGKDGERAQIQLSRYDKALLGITFDAGMLDHDVAEQNAKEFEKRAEAYFKANPGATSYSE